MKEYKTRINLQTHQITLGMNIPSEGKLTNQMWVDFLQSVLHLIQFATITDAVGIFKGEMEASKIISITIDERTTGSDRMIKNLLQVGELYKKQFRQDCIMYSMTKVDELVFQ
tara:strand:+ start:4852 stop:5190 length:339 start_codon:yes stop_codon:yes gene_type:complete